MVLKVLELVDKDYFSATALDIFSDHLKSEKFDVRRSVCKSGESGVGSVTN